MNRNAALIGVLIGLLLLLVTAPAFSGSERSMSPSYGKNLFQNCRAALRVTDLLDQHKGAAVTVDDGKEAIMCLSYIAGVVDMISLRDAQNDTKTLCSGKATNEQFIAVVVKWLEEHPAEQHKIGSYVVSRALTEAFPCPTEQEP